MKPLIISLVGLLVIVDVTWAQPPSTIPKQNTMQKTLLWEDLTPNQQQRLQHIREKWPMMSEYRKKRLLDGLRQQARFNSSPDHGEQLKRMKTQDSENKPTADKRNKKTVNKPTTYLSGTSKEEARPAWYKKLKPGDKKQIDRLYTLTPEEKLAEYKKNRKIQPSDKPKQKPFFEY